MSKASREIIKHYKKKCARKKSIKFRQVRVNEIEMISLAFYYSRARQQTKKRQLIDHQLSFSFGCPNDMIFPPADKIADSHPASLTLSITN